MIIISSFSLVTSLLIFAFFSNIILVFAVAIILAFTFFFIGGCHYIDICSLFYYHKSVCGGRYVGPYFLGIIFNYSCRFVSTRFFSITTITTNRLIRCTILISFTVVAILICILLTLLLLLLPTILAYMVAILLIIFLYIIFVQYFYIDRVSLTKMLWLEHFN